MHQIKVEKSLDLCVWLASSVRGPHLLLIWSKQWSTACFEVLFLLGQGTHKQEMKQNVLYSQNANAHSQTSHAQTTLNCSFNGLLSASSDCRISHQNVHVCTFLLSLTATKHINTKAEPSV